MSLNLYGGTSSLPVEIDADAIAEEAMQAAYALIASRLERAGYPVTGDVTPDEARRLDDAFREMVHSMAVNNPIIAELNEEW